MSAALMTFVGDVLKGAIPVIVVRAAGFPSSDYRVGWSAAFVGAICSVFLFFQGGKGIAARWNLACDLANGDSVRAGRVCSGRCD